MDWVRFYAIVACPEVCWALALEAVVGSRHHCKLPCCRINQATPTEIDNPAERIGDDDSSAM
jgi:hypothetical protein